MDLTKVEGIKEEWQEYTELYKKGCNDPDNKASRVDRISAELFQILKDDAVKMLHSNASKFGKLSSGHRTGKGQFSF